MRGHDGCCSSSAALSAGLARAAVGVSAGSRPREQRRDTLPAVPDKSSKQARLGLGALAGLVLGVAVLTRLGADGGRDGDSRRGVRAGPPRLSAEFAILRRRRSRRDAVPAALEGNWFMNAERPAFTQSRWATRTRLGDDVYVIPTAAGACLASTSGRAAACSTARELISGDNVAAVVCAPSLPDSLVEVALMLRDSAHNVTATRARAPLAHIKPAHNTVV